MIGIKLCCSFGDGHRYPGAVELKVCFVLTFCKFKNVMAMTAVLWTAFKH
jgi:hypothetical protein